MSAEHEINSLIIEMSGGRPQFRQARLKQKIESVIQHYFDKYDVEGKDIFIDSIRFDIDSLDSDYIEEELLLRLSFLLDSELKKFLSDPEVISRTQSQRSEILQDSFKEFILNGFSKSDNRSLDQIVQGLLRSDLIDFQDYVDEYSASEKLLFRLFEQVSFKTYEEYWEWSRKSVYTKVRRFNLQILTDLQPYLKIGKERDFQRFIERITFEVLMSTAYVRLTSDEVIKQLLVRYTKEATKFLEDSLLISEQNSKTAIEQYLYPSGTSDASASIIAYLNAPGDHDESLIKVLKSLVSRLSTGSLERDLLPSILLDEINIPSVRLRKLLAILNSGQFQVVYRFLKKHLSLFKELPEFTLLQVADLAKKKYQVIVYPDLIHILADIKGRPQVNDRFKKTLRRLIDSISARRSFSSEDLISGLVHELNTSNSTKDSNLGILLNTLADEIVLEKQLAEEGWKQWGKVRILIHFLESGVFLYHDDTPKDLLISIIGEDFQGLLSHFNSHIENDVFWVRFIHQFSLDDVLLVFDGLFGQRLSYQSVKGIIRSIRDRGVFDPQKDLLLTYIRLVRESHLNSDSSEKVINAEIKAFWAQRYYPQIEQTEYVVESATDWLSEWKQNGQPETPLQVRNAVLAILKHEIHVLLRFLVDDEIEIDHWEVFFKGLDRIQMVEIIQRLSFSSPFPEIIAGLQLLRVTDVASRLSIRQLTSLIVFGARRQSAQIKLVMMQAWESFQTEKPQRVEEVLLVVKRTSTLNRWLESTQNLQNIDDFVNSFRDILNSGVFKPKLEFTSFGSFEVELRRHIQRRELSILSVFYQVDIERVITFLQKLSHVTISAIKLHLEQKYRDTLYFDSVFALKSTSGEERDLLERFSLAYGLVHMHFNVESFLAFVEIRMPSIKVTGNLELLKAPLGRGLSTTHIYQSIKWKINQDQDRIKVFEGQALLDIIHTDRDQLISLIRADIKAVHTVSEFFSLLPTSKWAYFISVLLNKDMEWVKKMIGENQPKNLKSRKDELSALLIVSIFNQGSIESLESISILKSPLDLDLEEVEVLNEVDSRIQDHILREDILKMPHGYVRIGINELYQDFYTVFHLLEEVLKNGVFPFWSSIHTSPELIKVIDELYRHTPRLAAKFVVEELEKPNRLRNLLRLMGPDNFIELLRRIDPERQSLFQTLANSLATIHMEWISFDRGYAYFLDSCVKILSQRPYLATEEVAVYSMSAFAIELGVSDRIYLEGISMKASEKLDNYEMAFVHAFLKSRSYTLNFTEEQKLQQSLDLLEALLVDQKTPWWQRVKKSDNRSINKQVEGLATVILGYAQAKWISAVEKMRFSGKVYNFLSGHLTHQQFDQMLLALAPSFGGFVVSVNLLVENLFASHPLDNWRKFLILTIRSSVQFDAHRFIKLALPKLKESTSYPEKKLLAELTNMARELLTKGETRFMPVLDILEKSDIAQIIDQESEEFEASQRDIVGYPITYDFVDVLSYYLRVGSIPIDSAQLFDSLIDFTLKLDEQYQAAPHQIRGAIRNALRESTVRKRLLAEEKSYLIGKLTEILYPHAVRELYLVERPLIELLSTQWSSASESVLFESYLIHLLENAVHPATTALRAEALLAGFIKKAIERWGIIELENEDELHGIPPNIADLILELSSSKHAGSNQTKAEKSDDQSILKSNATPLDENLRDNENQNPESETKEDTIEVYSDKSGDVTRDKSFSSGDERQEKKNQPEPPIIPDVMLDFEVNIRNAGLVIAWPYLVRYFDMLEMLDGQKFKTEEDAVRAVLLLQYVATGNEFAAEHELLLNKVLCGVKIATPVAFEINLTDKEREVTEQMLKGLLSNWNRLKNTSIDALREGFILRDGQLMESEETWNLKVEKKTIDILMESMPWSYSMIKLPWMSKRLFVEWG